MKKLFLILLVLAGCGRELQPVPVPPMPVPTPTPMPGPVPVPSRDKVIIAAFGAPWCSACKSQLPALEKQIARLSAAQRDAIDYRMYIVTGGNPSVAATQVEADNYCNVLHLSASCAPDPWRYTYFKKWVGGQVVIPAAAVIDGSGKIRPFRAGETSFSPSEIVDFAVRSLR